jgi:hypothetical protein
VPTSCRTLFDIFPKTPFTDYQIIHSEDSIYDYKNFVDKTAFATSYKAPGADNDKFEVEKGVLATRLSQAADALCQEFRLSADFGEARRVVNQIDDLLEHQDKPGVPSRELSTSSEPHDTNAVYLLALNRFGPLVVIFFISSMIHADHSL